MVPFWDIVGKAANLFQLFGVDAVTASLLRFHEMNTECRKLEERVRMLRLLLHSPGCYWVMQHVELHLLTNALKEAHELVESYNGSTLFARLWGGRGMAMRLRDLRSSIHSYCGLIVSFNAFILVVEADPPSLVIR
ncbi:unnamed protein product [Miscanthus lutarioriparius]|uniref:Uncharacterized protein n=1 Tax=Miscanthus lutarioriparius TaxID=422564 RepID=A0A811Q9N3_9POAL|nr:unnamed protein product [Miscanthus lutarioriparius]